MLIRRLLTVLFASGLLGFSAAFGQGPPPAQSAQSVQAKSFVSLDGGFSIDLPQHINGFRGTNPIPGRVKGGSQFTWRLDDAFYSIGFIDRILGPGEDEHFLGNLADEFINATVAGGAKLVRREEISVAGYPAIALTFSKQNVVAHTRYLLVKDRLFVISGGWLQTEDGSKQLKLLDSFRLMDGKAIIARMLADATPAPLPQTPAVRRVRSDAEDELLKGPVNSVLASHEDTDANGSTAGVRATREDFYDRSGYLLKSIPYDYRGNPMEVMVYGFLDGKRVRKTGAFIEYEYNPPPMMAGPSADGPAPPRKPADERYDSSTEYKYDSSKRLIEELNFNNRGEPGGRSTYQINGDQVTETYFDAKGNLSFKSLSVFNTKGLLTQKTHYSTSTSYPADSVYQFLYLTFDDHGNWTKREVRGKSAKYGGGTEDLHYFEYRTITYY